jgi:protocatechuate 3,4-dioxygenase beta subunit
MDLCLSKFDLERFRVSDENHDFHHPKTGEIIKRTMDHSFQYWGKILTNENGEYEFKTIVPGFYPADLQSGWYRPPHIHFMVSATGYPQLVTQLYFKSDKIDNNEWIQELNEKDPILQFTNFGIVIFNLFFVENNLAAVSFL